MHVRLLFRVSIREAVPDDDEDGAAPVVEWNCSKVGLLFELLIENSELDDLQIDELLLSVLQLLLMTLSLLDKDELLLFN